MSEPCPRCERDDCAVKEETSNADWTDLVMCLTRTAARALAAEKQLATLQQTVDAIVRERDALRGKVERLKQIAQTARNAKLSRFETGPVSTAKVRAAHKLADKFLAILNDKETP